MTFESMHDAMQTLTTFGRDVINLYEAKLQQASDPAVRSCLKLAIESERRLMRGASAAFENMPPKQRAAKFKWHDREELMKIVPRQQHKRSDTVDEALEIVAACDEGVRAYCEALTASTHSPELVDLLRSIAVARTQELRDLAWQVRREPVG